MDRAHWNYFLAIESDLELLGRFIEFAPENFNTYSVELARLLMAATQEIDVVMKGICEQREIRADNEGAYRWIVPQIHPNLLTIGVELARYPALSFHPFAAWADKQTPAWWTANNKVKHERHAKFALANLENTLGAITGLFISNLYLYKHDQEAVELYPNPKFLLARNAATGEEVATGAAYTILGTRVTYTPP